MLPKKVGSLRPIMDLRPLNKFIDFVEFQVTSLKSTLSLLEEGIWMAILDLQNANSNLST